MVRCHSSTSLVPIYGADSPSRQWPVWTGRLRYLILDGMAALKIQLEARKSPTIYVICITFYRRSMPAEIFVDGERFHMLNGSLQNADKARKYTIREKIKEMLTTKTKLKKRLRQGQGYWASY